MQKQPFKHRSNFWEVEFDLSQTEDFVLTVSDPNATEAKFDLNNTKLYVSIVTMSVNDIFFSLKLVIIIL